MTPEQIAAIRRTICSSLEELGGVNTRLCEIEDGTGGAFELAEIEQWLQEAARQLEEAAHAVQTWSRKS